MNLDNHLNLDIILIQYNINSKLLITLINKNYIKENIIKICELIKEQILKNNPTLEFFYKYIVLSSISDEFFRNTGYFSHFVFLSESEVFTPF